MPVIDKSAPEGNAFAIMGLVHRLLKETDRLDEWPEVKARMTAGNYDNLCQVAEDVSYGSITFAEPGDDDF